MISRRTALRTRTPHPRPSSAIMASAPPASVRPSARHAILVPRQASVHAHMHPCGELPPSLRVYITSSSPVPHPTNHPSTSSDMKLFRATRSRRRSHCHYQCDQHATAPQSAPSNGVPSTRDSHLVGNYRDGISTFTLPHIFQSAAPFAADRRPTPSSRPDLTRRDTPHPVVRCDHIAATPDGTRRRGASDSSSVVSHADRADARAKSPRTCVDIGDDLCARVSLVSMLSDAASERPLCCVARNDGLVDDTVTLFI